MIPGRSDMTELESAIEREQEEGGSAIVEDSENVGPYVESEGKPKKRRRSARIITEKKFDCKHPGCGRQYSRAEHLYRHQLNRKKLSPSTSSQD